jgi:hypothetical protein
MSNFTGVIIEESLENSDVLKRVKITGSQVERVTERHRTPGLSQWSLRWVEIAESEAAEIADALSRSLDRRHAGSWYADFRNATQHYIIFRDKVFLIDRHSREQYRAAIRYGISLGIPEHQLDFRTLEDEPGN